MATSTVPGTPTIVNAYDLDLLPSSVTVDGPSPLALSFARDSRNGFLTGTSVGTVTTTHTYDTYGAPSSLTAKAGSSVLYSVALTPDGAGRITQKVETVQGVSRTYAYTYDDADRLTDLTIDGVSAGHWSYDGNGNRLTGTAVADPGVTLTGTYDAQDRLLSYGQTTYEFGPRGDLRSKTVAGKTTTYVYDVVGALVVVALPSGDRIDYVLDATGRRIGKKVNGALERGWLYEGTRIIAEADETGAIVARFVYGTRSHAPDMMWKGGVLYRFVTDERGSIRLVVNASTGAVVQRLDYDVWGNVTANSAPGFQPFGYAGGLWDPSTQLLRFGARDYDAEIGRWTSKDPLRFGGGDANLYLYVGDDPVNRLDPAGLASFGFSFGGTVFTGLGGFSATTSIVFDTHGGIGLLFTTTVSFGPGWGEGTTFGFFFNGAASTIRDLGGPSRGWSANLGAWGAGAIPVHTQLFPTLNHPDGRNECREGLPDFDMKSLEVIDGFSYSIKSPGFVVSFSLDLSQNTVIVLREPR